MSETPFFSVCIPCFNHGNYVGETIRSVLDQSFEDFEIVISDNASTDNSLAMVKQFRDPRIRLLENRYNIGFAPNLQRVTAAARGKFIILLSSDDLMRPGALSCYSDIFLRQGERAEQTVIFSASEVIDEGGNIKYIKFKREGEICIQQVAADRAEELGLDSSAELMRGKGVLRRALVEVKYPGVFCTTAYPRSLWQRVEGYDTTYQYMPDAAFLHKLLALDPDYVYVNRCLFKYRVHGSNQMAQAAGQGALRHQVDGYMRTVNYPQPVLDSLKLSRDHLVRGFLEEFCLRESLGALSIGNWSRAFKLFSFAFASYPQMAIRLPKTYLTGAILATGPLGIAAGKVARWVNNHRGNGNRHVGTG